jgi:hypothetical protein
MCIAQRLFTLISSFNVISIRSRSEQQHSPGAIPRDASSTEIASPHVNKHVMTALIHHPLEASDSQSIVFTNPVAIS